MAIAVGTTRQSLATYYSTLGAWLNAATGAPGTSATPSNEATGGSPANARKQTTWTPSTGGVVNGSAITVDVAAATYTHIILASASSGANMIDNADVTDVVMSAQGQIVITPTYTQT
jgi:hypothetical protein